jgi:uncharacterized RDD family membrane protein YckC
LAQGQLNQLSFHFDVFANVFSVYLPLLDLKSVIIVAIIWAATTTVALGFWDSTLGQKILHLKIIHMHREHLGWPWALLRQVIYLPLSIISVIGILMGLTGSRRCWHDYLSGCKVTYY